MSYCYDLETPQSVKDDDNIDVFDVMAGDDTHKAKITKAMWARWGLSPLGHPDRAYWQRNLKMRFDAIIGGYKEAFDVYEAYLLTDYTDLSDGSSEVTFEHENTPDMAVGDSVRYLSSRDTTKARSFSGLPSVTLKNDLDAVTDPYRMFAEEFKDLFCQRMIL